MVVPPDADVDAVIRGIAIGIFFNAGQSCMAGARLRVQESLHDRVAAGVAQRTKALRVGSGSDAATRIGPLVSRPQRQRVTDYLEAGRREAAPLLAIGLGARERRGRRAGLYRGRVGGARVAAGARRAQVRHSTVPAAAAAPVRVARPRATRRSKSSTGTG